MKEICKIILQLILRYLIKISIHYWKKIKENRKPKEEYIDKFILQEQIHHSRYNIILGIVSTPLFLVALALIDFFPYWMYSEYKEYFKIYFSTLTILLLICIIFEIFKGNRIRRDLNKILNSR